MQISLKKSYFWMIENAIGSTQWQKVWMKDEHGGEKEVLENGNLSCANVVSSILHRWQLIHAPHLTVSGTIKDMLASGWVITTTPRPGAVIHWGPSAASAGHGHIGFLLENNQAMSNSSTQGYPVQHPQDFSHAAPEHHRPIIAYYWHPKLEE